MGKKTMEWLILDIETTGLNPIEDRILCITMKSINGENEKVMVSDDEKAILTNFFDSIEDTFFTPTVYTFNGDSFDIPFIIKRCIINKVPIKSFIYNTVDIRKLVNSFKLNHDIYTKGTLRDWAKILGIEVKTQDGGKMKELFEAKQWVLIKEHCREDVEILRQLCIRCYEVGLL
jgi:uncharacterized protein YprB with RNaseH-like and TPR domain